MHRRDLLAETIRLLTAAGIPDPAAEARWLVVAALDLPDRAALASHAEQRVTPAEHSRWQEWVARRCRHEPLSRIVGRREFYGLTFAISPATLDPRPDSEILIEQVRQQWQKTQPPARILDIGTGSGCLLLTLLQLWPTAHGVATDISEAALAVARQNAAALGLAARIELVLTRWAEGITGPFDIIISNPPYIRRDVLGSLDPAVRDYDPLLALDGGPDGLDAYRALIPQARALLAPNGLIALEIGYDQAAAVLALADGGTIYPDLGGRPRVIVLD